MKKWAILVAAVVVLLMFVSPVSAKKNNCITIQDGVLAYSAGHYLDGEPLQAGYDPYGYNYQGHMFNGSYANSYLGKDDFPPYDGDDEAYLAENPSVESMWYWPYRGVSLMMKWNDAWLSNKDCGIDGVDGDPDGELDRHYGYVSYVGSGAWLTNHQSGEEEDKMWTYFTKIVAKPVTGCNVIWTNFCTIQEVNGGNPELNVSYGGNGAVVLENPAGFGFYKP